MNQQQVYLSNEIIQDYGVTWYKRLWLVDLVKQYSTIEEVVAQLNKWLPEEQSFVYERKVEVVQKQNTSSLCEYDWMWVWSKCKVCWEARWDKQNSLEKRCTWKI